jgi:hypothetical protein
MQTVIGRLLQPTFLLVGLLLVALIVTVVVLLWLGGAHETEQLVGPFRWEPMSRLG